jgi:uncharacterized membrane protein
MTANSKPNEALIKNILELIVVIFVYGFLLSIISTYFLKSDLNFFSIVSFGLVWYFSKYELPFLVRRYIGDIR